MCDNAEPYQVGYAVVCVVLPNEGEGKFQIISHCHLSPVHTCNNNDTVSTKIRSKTAPCLIPYTQKPKPTDVNVAFAAGGVSGSCHVRRGLSFRGNCRRVSPCLQLKTHDWLIKLKGCALEYL